MGDLECEFQKNCVVETPWKFEAKTTIFGPIFISDRSSANPSKKLSCFSGIPRGVLKHEQKKFWIWNFGRVRFAGRELLILLIIAITVQPYCRFVTFWPLCGHLGGILLAFFGHFMGILW